MQFSGKKRRTAPSIIIVSLIDVPLVVLIFLMVTTSFKKQPAVKVNLPTTSLAHEGTGEGVPPFVVSITKDPPYLRLDSGPVTLDHLRQIMAEQVARNPNLSVAIRADTDAHLGEVFKVEEMAKLLKVRNSPGVYVLPEVHR